ncbi:MAG: V-type ATP synthase subunit E family protein [Nanoarchaeota archaeon]
MGLKDLKQDILEQAKEKAKEITQEAKADSAKELKKTKEQSVVLKKKAADSLDQEKDRLRQKELSNARFVVKRKILDAKNSLIDGSFAEAKKLLQTMPAKEREAILQTLLKRAQTMLDVKKVYVNDKDKGLKFPDVEKTSIDGGLIGESKDTRVRVDFSYETILDSIRDESIMRIGKLLGL